MMMKNFRKGQAALEFLTTYGWAFLVILVMIGALGYFGILNPSSFLPQRCTTGPEFNCNDFQVQREGNASIILESQIGEAIESISFLNASVDDRSVSCTIPAVPIGAGADILIVCDISGSGGPGELLPPAGDKGIVVVEGAYTPVGRQFAKPLVVEVYATIQ